MFFFDPLYFIMLAPAIGLTLWATFKVKRTFARYNRVPVSSGRSGRETAEMLLRRQGIHIPVEQHPGALSDHYDPRVRVLRLSPEVYSGRTVGAVAVAAHEVGHALQHHSGYQPLMFRQVLARPASFASSVSWILLLGGFLLGAFGLVQLGIALFSLVVLFQVVTLPVELNASRRAKALVWDTGLITPDERRGVSRVLSAAAMTYVAAALTGVVTLLYYLLRSGLLGGDE